MKRKTSPALYLTRGAIIAALYVVLTYLSALFGLSSGVVQLRISEALCILPMFFANPTNGVFAAEPLSNLIGGSASFFTMLIYIYKLGK